MSRIASISLAARTLRHNASEHPVKPVTAKAALPMVINAAPRRARHRAAVPQMAAYNAQILAGPARRGLKADPAEQQRIFANYAKVQNLGAPASPKIKILA